MIAPFFLRTCLILCSAAVDWLKTKDGEVSVKHVIILRTVTMSQVFITPHYIIAYRITASCLGAF